MKCSCRGIAGALMGTLLMFGVAHTQDLSQQLSKIGKDAAQSFVAPFLSGFGADLNSAFYHSADLHDVLGFDLGVKVGLSKVLDEDKTYIFTMPASFSYQGFTLLAGRDYDQQYTAPTAVGSKDGVPVNIKPTSPYYGFIPANQRTFFKIPGGFDLSSVPLLVPQVAIGLPFGLEVVGRFVPTMKAGDYGKVSMQGFGLRHSIDQYIPLCPVNIAIHFMTQKLSLKDSSDNNLVSASATAYGVEVSKKLLILTLYGGFQLEKGTLTVGPYTQIDNSGGSAVNITIPAFDVSEQNSSRFTVGARLLLLFLNIHAEYSFAKTPVLAAGASISIR